MVHGSKNHLQAQSGMVPWPGMESEGDALSFGAASRWVGERKWIMILLSSCHSENRIMAETGMVFEHMYGLDGI